ncbi:MAG: hypothetical protein H0V54_11515 [Chthoniobacterales bacterium]|nr:hypothetical protein [Chthoniobacterales bacterium]
MKVGNVDLAELLAADAKDAEGVMRQALKRAARSAFLWPEHAADLLAAGRHLTELHGVGPSLAKRITAWIEKPPALPRVRDPLRRDFLTLADARIALNKKPAWAKQLRGDLQMHTRWSDGSGTVQEMADAAAERGYEYIAITDHTKGLSIAGGINEDEVAEHVLPPNSFSFSWVAPPLTCNGVQIGPGATPFTRMPFETSAGPSAISAGEGAQLLFDLDEGVEESAGRRKSERAS